MNRRPGGSVPSVYSADDMAALLRGFPTPPTSGRLEGGTDPRLTIRRGVRCHRCMHLVPQALSFYGDKDWQGQLADEARVRKAVSLVRRLRRKRRVDLCDDCLDDLGGPAT